MKLTRGAEKLHLIKRQICSVDETLVKLVDETEEGKYLLSIIGLAIVLLSLGGLTS